MCKLKLIVNCVLRCCCCYCCCLVVSCHCLNTTIVALEWTEQIKDTPMQSEQAREKKLNIIMRCVWINYNGCEDFWNSVSIKANFCLCRLIGALKRFNALINLIVLSRYMCINKQWIATVLMGSHSPKRCCFDHFFWKRMKKNTTSIFVPFIRSVSCAKMKRYPMTSWYWNNKPNHFFFDTDTKTATIKRSF